MKDDVTEAAEKSDGPSEKIYPDALGKKKGKGENKGRCNVGGEDGHLARD